MGWRIGQGQPHTWGLHHNCDRNLGVLFPLSHLCACLFRRKELPKSGGVYMCTGTDAHPMMRRTGIAFLAGVLAAAVIVTGGAALAGEREDAEKFAKAI